MKHPVRKGSFFVAVAAVLVTAVVSATAVAATATSGATRAASVRRGRGLGRPGVHAQLQSVQPRHPARLHVGRHLREPPHLDRCRRRPPVQRPRPELRVVEERQDADHHRAAGREVVGRQAADGGGRARTASPSAGRTRRPTGSASSRRTATSPASRASARNKVAIRFKQVDSTFLGSQLPTVPIVPKHVWSKVKNVVNFANPNPVGSGPFNRVTRFSGQSYQLSKNPNYWAKGLPRIDCVQRIFTASNDAGLLQIVSGQADWTHNFVPNVESAYMAKDPKHYHNAYLTAGAAGQPHVQHDAVPVQPRRVPQGREPGDRPQDGLEARRVRLRAGDVRARARARSTRSGSTRPSGRKARQIGDLRPCCRAEGVHGRRVHVQGLEADRPEGQPGQLPDARDRRLVGLGRLAADHLPEPAGRRDRRVRQDRAGLAGVGIQQRDQRHQAEPDLEQRRRRPDAVRVLLLALRPVADRAHRRGCAGVRELRAQLQRPGGAAPAPVQGHARPEEAAGMRRTSCRRSSSTSCPTSRCSSARAGRPTARSTSRAGSPGRTSTPTRSSRRSSRCRSLLLSLYYADAKGKPRVPALPNVLAT